MKKCLQIDACVTKCVCNYGDKRVKRKRDRNSDVQRELK